MPAFHAVFAAFTASAGFTASTADALFPILLPTFKPGEYLITIDVTRGTTVISVGDAARRSRELP